MAQDGHPQHFSSKTCPTCGLVFLRDRDRTTYCSVGCSNARHSLDVRFWAKVDKTGSCWLWTGSRGRKGYGQIFADGRLQPAHRVSLRLHGTKVPMGLFVLHRCDNPPCVNPDHLFVGTAADNTADMIGKGRYRSNPPRGEAHGQAKLSESQALEIRVSREPVIDSARRFGVSATLVRKIRSRELWAHI